MARIGAVFSLALRNVLRHAGHSLLLGGLFALAAFLFISGNSLLSHSNRVLRSLFVDTVTADAVIAARSEESVSLFGTNTPAIGEVVPIPLLPDPEELSAAVAEQPGVERVSPLVSVTAVMDVLDSRDPVPVFGVEPESYFSVLDRLEITEGRALSPGERGVMLTESRRRRIEADSGRELPLGEEVLFTTGDRGRVRIRAAPLVGVFRYPVEMEYVDEIAILDAENARELARVATRVITDTGPAEGPRSAEEVDSLFGEEDGEEESAERGGTGVSAEGVLERVQSADSEDAEEQAAGGDGAGAAEQVRTAAHFLLVRGETDEALAGVAEDYDVQVLSWREAAGQPALLALLLQMVFNGGFVLFIVAVTLAVTNITLISTYRRSREIGTLRAIGASDATVRGVFAVEHLIVGVGGWLAGLGLSAAASAGVGAADLTVENRLIAMLLGGGEVSLPVGGAGAAAALAVVIAVVAVSVLVPLAQVMRKPAAEAVRGL